MTQQTKPAAPQEVAERVLTAKGGDEDAIEALARRASASAYRTSLVALGDPHAAADVSQETAVRALRSLKGLRDPEKFDAWVYRITVAEIRRSLAKNQRHDHEPLAVHMTALVSDGMAAAVEDRIWRRAGIRDAVKSLSDRQRIALALRYVHDLPDPEIAAALKCREGTVRSLLSRSLRTLAKHPALAEHDPIRPVESDVALNSKELLNGC